MNLIVKVALRNLLRHKGKTLVIGSILFIGAVMMILGNATVASMKKGFQDNFVNNFMGDITIVSTNGKLEDIIQGIPKPMKTIANYTNLRETLNGLDYVDRFVPLTKGLMFMMDNNSDNMIYIFCFGVDMNKYLSMFNTNIVILEGRYLTNNETGLLLNSGYRKDLYNGNDKWFVTRSQGLVVSNLTPEAKSNEESLVTADETVVMGLSDNSSGSDIRIPVTGVFKFRALNAALSEINFVDIESFRECAGYYTAADSQVEISAATTNLLNMDSENLDDLFSSDTGDSMFAAVPFQSVTHIRTEKPVEKVFADPDLGSYNLVFVKLKRGVNRDEAVTMMDKVFKERHLDAQAMTWRVAAGNVASMADIAGYVVNVLIGMIFFVAVIIIVNTLNMAAMERSSEIGMMRAVGAQKSFISRMFAVETSVISLIFGGAGIIVGALLVVLLGAFNIPAGEDFTAMIFGGDYYKPLLSAGTVILGIFELGVVTVLSMIFPIRLARKITPLDAISRE